METAYSIDLKNRQNNSDRVLILDGHDLRPISLFEFAREIKGLSERNKASLKAILVHLSIFRFVYSTGLVS